MKSVITICFACFLCMGLFAQQSDPTYAYRADGDVIATNAPRLDGISYRVQLLTTSHFNEEDPALKTLQQYGKVRTEFLIDRKTTRILLGDFKELIEAKQCLGQVREFGLNEATIIRYRNGYRQGSIADLES